MSCRTFTRRWFREITESVDTICQTQYAEKLKNVDGTDIKTTFQKFLDHLEKDNNQCFQHPDVQDILHYRKDYNEFRQNTT